MFINIRLTIPVNVTNPFRQNDFGTFKFIFVFQQIQCNYFRVSYDTLKGIPQISR